MYKRVSSLALRRKANNKPYRRSRLTSTDIYTVLRHFPDLEKKYLNIMKLPITGKESIELPFDFSSHHHHHACLDLSPYGNEQVSKSACNKCTAKVVPSASDALVAFMNQASTVMQNRKFYYGFRKNNELIKLSGQEPSVFQTYYILNSVIPDIVPIMFPKEDKLHMYIIFESKSIHLPSECINQILLATSGYNVSINIIQDYTVLILTCEHVQKTSIKFDYAVLQRKLEEMDIPDDINEKYEKYRNTLSNVCCFK
ncbi:nuclear egress lamina protein [Suid betaherpesvirus 2]|uniref:Nuclear egress lamina protein n=1 Tax=Suid betaherpesvirus 2 TaxID=1608255 RepID=Q9IFI2_9BETA|nr:nuclear egress lamina protein [Suid betaherpesvirus 2]AAF80112.1 ORF 37-like protein [Suid betaherpesvirus 2]AGT99231.1 nuclear egress lamina protein [Suid betaherpesvirus 2]